MDFKITRIRLKEMPSKFGGTWKLAAVKVEGHGEDRFELSGYGTKYIEKLAEGSVIRGYESSKTYNNIVTKTINKITAEYVYDLLMAMRNPSVGTTSMPVAAVSASTSDGNLDSSAQDDNW